MWNLIYKEPFWFRFKDDDIPSFSILITVVGLIISEIGTFISLPSIVFYLKNYFKRFS